MILSLILFYPLFSRRPCFMKPTPIDPDLAVLADRRRVCHHRTLRREIRRVRPLLLLLDLLDLSIHSAELLQDRSHRPINAAVDRADAASLSRSAISQIGSS
jgi:hypothetical protein